MHHAKESKDNNEQQKGKKQIIKENLRAKSKLSKRNKHRARLIVRNLPFAVTQDNLHTHFKEFGEIDEIKILKREDAQVLGCGFVQFKLVQSAAKARHYINGKPFLGREIECDWAVPKNKFENQEIQEEVKIKEEEEEYSIDKIKTEPVELADTTGDDSNVEVKDTKSDESDDTQSDVSDSSKEESDEEDDPIEVKEEVSETPTAKPKFHSNDTTEGKTIFITNLPFLAKNEDVKECFSKFGPLYYALVCMDSLTEHSKGTAFVKFRNKEDADKCLQTSNLTLMGNTLELRAAVTRDALRNKSKDKSNTQKDSRNLYLVKEGVIMAGTKSAEGVSASDMAKRLQLELYKTQMLRNLNMIVARTRLVVHNIPSSWDDSKLRTLFKKHSSPKSVIKEARIMRNMSALNDKGVGKSKEFGFVTYTTHEAALEALRAINNNPTIFSVIKRPIIAFSIENRAKLLVKQRRLHNSQIHNPTSKNYNSKAIKFKPKFDTSSPVVDEDNKSHFSGTSATPGSKKMRSKFNLKTQAKVHFEQLKKEKKKKKNAKKTLAEKRSEFTKLPRQKINKNKGKEDDNFSKLVKQYKSQLFGSSSTHEEKRKTKWYS